MEEAAGVDAINRYRYILDTSTKIDRNRLSIWSMKQQNLGRICSKTSQHKSTIENFGDIVTGAAGEVKGDVESEGAEDVVLPEFRVHFKM